MGERWYGDWNDATCAECPGGSTGGGRKRAAFFRRMGHSDLHRWRSDGTAAGTVLLKSVDDMDGNSIDSFQSVGSLAYFTTTGGTYLWRSDGTLAGTVEVKHVSGGMDIDHMFNFNGTLLFSASAGHPGHHELWRSDGKSGNTLQISDINPAGDADPQNVTTLGNIAFFSALGTDGQRDLAATDPKQRRPGGERRCAGYRRLRFHATGDGGV